MIGAGEPRYADAVPEGEPVDARSERVDMADDFVPRGDVRAAGREISFRQMQVGPAHAATRDPDPYLARGPGTGRSRSIRRSGFTVDRPAFVHHPSLHLLPPVSRRTRVRLKLTHSPLHSPLHSELSRRTDERPGTATRLSFARPAELIEAPQIVPAPSCSTPSPDS